MVLMYLSMFKILFLMCIMLIMFMGCPYCNCRQIGKIRYTYGLMPIMVFFPWCIIYFIGKNVVKTEYIILDGIALMIFAVVIEFRCCFGFMWVYDDKLHVCQYPFIHRAVSFDELREGAKEIAPLVVYDNVVILWCNNHSIRFNESVGTFDFVDKLFEDIGWENPKLDIYDKRSNNLNKSQSALLRYIKKRDKEYIKSMQEE